MLRGPGLICDFGPSSSSGGEDRWRGQFATGRMQAGGAGSLPDGGAAGGGCFGAFGPRRTAGGGTVHWQLGGPGLVRRRSGSGSSCSSRGGDEDLDSKRCRAPPPKRLGPRLAPGVAGTLTGPTGLRGTDAERWRSLAQQWRRAAARKLAASAAALTEAVRAARRISASWAALAERARARRLRQLLAAAAQAASEAARQRAAEAALRRLGGLLALGSRRSLAPALAKAGQVRLEALKRRQLLWRFGRVALRPLLRFGLKAWRTGHLTTSAAWHFEYCARQSARAAVQDCRRWAGARAVATSLRAASQRRQWAGFGALAQAARPRRAPFGGARLAVCLERILRRRLAGAATQWHGVVLRSLLATTASLTGRLARADAQRARLWRLRRAWVAWQCLQARCKQLRRCLTRTCWRLENYAWRRLREHARGRRCEMDLATACAARLEAERCEGDLGLEAMRQDLGAKLLAAQQALEAERQHGWEAQRRGALLLEARVRARLARFTWRAWSRSHAQAIALHRLARVLRVALCRRHVGQWRRRGDKHAVSFLEAQVDCFDVLVSQRTELARRVLHRCALERQAAEHEASQWQARLAWNEWSRLARMRQLRALRRRSACERLAATLLGVLRSRGLHRWGELLAWHRQVASEEFGCAEVVRLRIELETMISRYDRLTRESVSKETEHLTAAHVASATAAAAASHRWRLTGVSLSSLVARRLFAALREAGRVAASVHETVSAWQRTANGAHRIAAGRTCSALAAALVAAAADRRRTSDRRRALRSLAREAYSRSRFNFFCDLAAGARDVGYGCARIRHALHRFARAGERAGLRSGFSRLRARVAGGRKAAWERERHGALTCQSHSSGACMLWAVLCGVSRHRLRQGFAHLQCGASFQAGSRAVIERLPPQVQLAARHLQRLVQHRTAQAVSSWCRAVVVHRGDVFTEAGVARRAALLATRSSRRERRRSGCRALCLWRSLACGPRRLARSLARISLERLAWSLQRLRLHASCRGHLLLQAACFAGATRRRRIALLASALRHWRIIFCAKQRVQRQRLQALQQRTALRHRRFAIAGLHAERVRARAARHLGALLWRAAGSVGLRAWRARAACDTVAGLAAALDDARLEREKQSRDGSAALRRLAAWRLPADTFSARTFLHVWRCHTALAGASAARFRAARLCSARVMASALATMRRGRIETGFERWRMQSRARGQIEAAEAVGRAQAIALALDRIRQGGVLLASWFRRRQLLAASSALCGSWRSGRWQALLRSCDAASAREQRRCRAERGALAALEEEVERLRAQELHEAERNDLALSETSLIADDVRRERRRHESALDSLRAALARSEASEAAARDEALAARACEREATAAQTERDAHRDAEMTRALRAEAVRFERRLREEAAELERRLGAATAQGAQLEQVRLAVLRQLGAARSELRDAGRAIEEKNRALHQRELFFSEQACCLQMQASSSGEKARFAEEAAELHAQRAELDIAARARRAEHELSAAPRWLPKHYIRLRPATGLGERTHASELQAAIAEEQERSIQRLEELLKEQTNELRRERRDHSRGIQQVRSSASFSASKSCLLEEQVLALREQLQREQAELRAKESAWAGDRAALLTVVTRGPTSSPSSGPSGCGRRLAQRKTGGGIVAIESAGNCPWHGCTRAP